MYKVCSRCGKVHAASYRCPKDYGQYRHAYEKIRYTGKWIKKSKEIREASKGLCEVCADEGIYNYKDLEVHHIVKIKDDSSKFLDNLNLISLCRVHHRMADNGELDVDYLKKLAKTREDNR